MDYEKLHKDTITKLQQMVNSGKITVEVARGICADFIPESEDEMIRKALIEHFKWNAKQILNDFDNKKVVAWLEKQAEQKPYKVEQKGMNIVEEDMTPFQKKVFCIIDTTIEEEQGLKQVCDELLRLAHDEIIQKPAWGEEDRKTIDYLIDYLESELDSSYTKEDKEEFTKEIELLKFLKPQSQWKPSDEQMDALHYVTNFDYGGYKATLVSLYEQLKKLKEELL